MKNVLLQLLILGWLTALCALLLIVMAERVSARRKPAAKKHPQRGKL